jgi:DNA-binding NarL/FixJ family response regulator
MSLRILLADDHQLLRQGLRALLEDESDLEVVGEADNGHEAVRLCKQLKPDMVVMDIGMPQLNGMEATRQVLADNPGLKVLALSMHTDRRFAAGMLQAGASGYLLKDAALEELVQAIRTVAAGKTYLSPAITQVVMEDYVQRLGAAEGSAFSVLSAREREVLQALAEGKSTREIAEELHVSTKTIETHRQQIMNKLDIHSVAELTKYAVREGLTSLEP